jgi:hypothetical protein
VEAGVDLFCGHCCEHKRKCLAKKSAVKEKYKNETKQHNNCQEQYNVCQVDRDNYKFWRNTWFFTTVVAGLFAVVFGLKLYMRNQELTLAKVALRNFIDAQEDDPDIHHQGVDGLAAVFHHI